MKMKFNILLLFVCGFVSTPAFAGGNEVKRTDEVDSNWNIDARFGVGADKNYKELDCEECKSNGYNGSAILSLDLTYGWSDFEAGLTGSFNSALFKEPQYYVGATFGWRRDLTGWLEAKVTSEAGAHIMVDVVDDFFVTVRRDSGDVVLPYVATRLSLDATVWEAAGLVLGVWGGAKFDLTREVVEADVEVWFSDETRPERVEVGGHLLAGGLTLGFEF